MDSAIFFIVNLLTSDSSDIKNNIREPIKGVNNNKLIMLIVKFELVCFLFSYILYYVVISNKTDSQIMEQEFVNIG